MEFHYKKEKIPIFKSKRKIGVRPTKQYKFEQVKVEEKINQNQTQGNESFDYNREFEEHINQYKGIISATQKEVDYLKYQKPKIVQNVDDYPYSAVGIIHACYKKTKKAFQATGVLIGSNLVFTVFHICDPQGIKQDVEIEFIPAPIHKRRGKAKAKGFKVMRKYLFEQVYQMFEQRGFNKGYIYDFAVLELDCELNLEEYFGSFGYNFSLDEYSFKKVCTKMKVFGYPPNRQLVEYKGQAFTDKYYFITKMPTDKGVSGAPLIMQNDKNFQIVGLHAKKIRAFLDNFHAVLKLRSEMFETITNQINLTLHSYGQSLQCRDQRNLLRLIDTIDSKEQKQKKIILDLESYDIGHQRCRHFSQVLQINLYKFNLYRLNLGKNNLGNEGCRYLSQSKWTNIQQLDLSNNNIEAEGCRYLSMTQWTNLQLIDLRENKIGSQGSKYLSQAQWNNLHRLLLWDCEIGNQGCRYLSQANWANLNQLYLRWNNITAEGCRYLSKANWTNLQSLYLRYNNIGKQGYIKIKNMCKLIDCDFQTN